MGQHSLAWDHTTAKKPTVVIDRSKKRPKVTSSDDGAELTEAEVRGALQAAGGRMKTKDLLVRFKARLKANPANKDAIKRILRAVADVQDSSGVRVLVLKAASLVAHLRLLRAGDDAGCRSRRRRTPPRRRRWRVARPLRLRAGADGRRSRGGKLGRAAQRELDGRGPARNAAPGTTQLVGVARPRRFSKERPRPAPEPEAAL